LYLAKGQIMSVECFFGRTLSGKSYKARQEIKNKKRVFVFDAACDFHGGIIFDKYDIPSLVELGKKIRNLETFQVNFRPDRHFGDIQACAERVAKFILAFGDTFGKRSLDEHIVFVLDELDKYISTSRKSFVKMVIEMGRHSNIDTYCISQVPASLPKFIRDNATKVYAFKLGYNDFYQYRFGPSITKELSGENLKDYWYYVWDDSNGIIKYNKRGKICQEKQI